MADKRSTPSTTDTPIASDLRLMELVLPSSPVWYQTKASDTSTDGIFAFVSRSLIYLLDIHEDVPSYFGILHGHEDRVTTCAFSTNKSSLLASGGDDCVVKVWNVTNKTVVHESNLSGCGKISALHWSPFSEDVVVYGDEKGCLVVWNFAKGSNMKYYPDGPHQQITCVVCSQHYQNLVALGYKSGAVSIVDIHNRGMVVRKFRGHGNEIHSIVWSHTTREDVVSFGKSDAKQESEEKLSSPLQNQYEGLVVSGSKDRTIRVWSLVKRKGIKILKLPSRPSKGKKTNEEFARIYVTLHWLEGSESSFLSSSYNGDLLMWDLSKPDKEMYQVLSSRTPDLGHQRVIFNINPGLNPRSDVITTSMDRQIKIWSFNNPQAPPLCSLPTLGGYVYDIKLSPIDPSIYALGVGDGAIRLWRTKNPRNPFDITVLWQGVKEKVMSLAWHPKKEGILAFGTEDGKVGIYDVLSMKPPTISETYHMKPVYAISWGPKCLQCEQDNDVTEPWLYTCGGEGVILMHPPDLKNDAIDVLSVISASNPDHTPGRRSEVAWRSDGRIVAMGNDNGTFDIYEAPLLRHLVTVKVHNKIINCLRWRPNNPGEPVSGWVASGSVNTHVCVTDIEPFLNKSTDEKMENVEPVITEPYRSLIGHASRITRLSWNSNNTFQLASASYDGTVQVWDVKEGVGLANYRGHDGRTLCVEWSPIVDTDSQNGLIYSGGDDYSVHVWKAEKQENKLPPKELTNFGFTQKHSSMWKKKIKKKKQQTSPQTDPATSTANDARDELDITALLENKKKELLADMKLEISTGECGDGDGKNSQTSSQPSASTLNPNANPFPAPPSDDVKEVMHELSESRSAVMEAKEEEKSVKRRRLKNLFPISVALDNQKKESQQLDCINIAKYRKGELLGLIPERPNLGLYGDRKSTFRMLFKEGEKLEESDNYFGSQTLKVWKGDIVGAVESAIERNELTDHIVAIAPMGGHDLWLKACSVFADQLAKEGYHMHAAQYLVAANKVSEAIMLLRESKHYREAVAMARTRLHDNDPLLIETIRAWAYRLKNGSSYEMAAKCFASIDDFQLAADCLSERARSKTVLGEEDLHSLFAAALVARSADLDSYHGYLRQALIDITTRSGRWAQGHSAARKFKNDLSYIRLILCAHELLARCVCSSTQRQFFSLDEFTDPVLSNWSKTLTVKDVDFAQTLKRTWQSISREYLSKERVATTAFADVECLCSQSSYDGLTMKQALFKASLHISCVYLCVECSHDDMTKSLRHHLTSLVSDPADSLKDVLRAIYQSFDSILSSKQPVKGDTAVACNGLNHELTVSNHAIADDINNFNLRHEKMNDVISEINS